jgi:hypothetical protein
MHALNEVIDGGAARPGVTNAPTAHAHTTDNASCRRRRSRGLTAFTTHRLGRSEDTRKQEAEVALSDSQGDPMTSTPHTPTSTATETARSRPRRVVRIGAVAVAVALAAGFIAWLVFGRGNRSETSSQTPTLSAGVPGATVARPAITSVRALQTLAAASTIPIYWVGARSGTAIELTRVPGGTVFVRYLPPGTRAGDPRAFLTIATYPRPKAYAEVQHAATASKSKTIDLAGGGLAVYDAAHATNVHLAYPGQPYQIEIYAPRQAVQLVESGAVRPAA